MTNPKIKQLEDINSQIKKIDLEIDSMMDNLSQLHTKKCDLFSQILEEEQLLKNSEWNLKHDPNLNLEYDGKKNDVIMQTFSKWLPDERLTWIDLEDGIQLRFNEDYVYLYFDDSKMILPFVNKHNIKIKGANITNKLLSLKREVAALEKICHQFSIKD